MRESGTRSSFRSVLMAAVCCAALAPVAMGQLPSPTSLPGKDVLVDIDSGDVLNPGAHPRVVFSAIVESPGSEWVRLHFAAVRLAGRVATEQAGYLQLTSLRDGAVQILDAEALAQWGNWSAFFNGPAVRVQLIASPGAGSSRVSIDQLSAHDPGLVFPQDICGPTDDRVAVTDPRVARFVQGLIICSAFSFNDTNHFYLSAGHCQPAASGVVQYNVPPSNPDGTINFPPPDDQYAVDATSVQRATNGAGNDWAYFGVFPNSNSGLQPPQVYGGAAFTLAAAPPAPAGQTVRVSGYGSTDGFNLPFTQSFTLTTDAGPYTGFSQTLRYNVDTTGGNSGSAVEDLATAQVIGIHYLGACASAGNQATPINNSNLQFALTNPIAICRTGRGTVGGNLYAIGDLANNFGTVSAHPVRFAKIAQTGARWQGLAFDRNRQMFYATTNTALYTVGTDGAATFVADITGAGGQFIHGLGFDPGARVLYGMAASVGQLYVINTATAAATPIGSPQGGFVSALEYDPVRATLWGINNSPQSRLVRVSTATGEQTVIGNVGSATFVNCHGLAFNPADSNLYTINGSSSIIYRLNTDTGVGTNVGVSFGVFGSAFGMSASGPAPACPADFNGDGFVDPDDLSDFITCFFLDVQTPGVCPQSDFNADGFRDPDDLADFVTAFFVSSC